MRYSVGMPKTVNTTALRSNLSSVMQCVRKTKKPVIITDRGVPVTVMIDIDEFEDFLFSQQPEHMKRIKLSKEQAKKGEVFTLEEVFAGII